MYRLLTHWGRESHKWVSKLGHHWFDNNTFSETIMNYCPLVPREQISVKFESKSNVVCKSRPFWLGLSVLTPTDHRWSSLKMGVRKYHTELLYFSQDVCKLHQLLLSSWAFTWLYIPRCIHVSDCQAVAYVWFQLILFRTKIVAILHTITEFDWNAFIFREAPQKYILPHSGMT